MIEAIELDNPRSRSTAVRHRPIADDQQGTKLQPGVPARSRRGAMNNMTASRTNLRPVQPYDTGADYGYQEPTTQPPIPLRPGVQTLPEQGFLKRCLKNPLVVVCLTILGGLAFLWLSTAFLGWCVMHTDDPGQFGPTHGNVITTVLGGGDSPDHPTKLVAMNNGGVVEIVKITANDPTKSPQLLTVANLVTSGFPDPTNANIELQAVGDHIQMTVLSTVWNLPFNRVQQTVTLVKDGNGGLKSP